MRFLTLLLTCASQVLCASATRAGTVGTVGTVKTSDGIRLHYNQTGPRHGQNMLFITGWRQTALEWHKQADYFSSAGFRVTTYDMRGHGDSEEPDFGYRLSRFAADLNDLLTQLDLEDLTIVGHSMGCSVAWAWWDQYPEVRKRVSHFVFADDVASLVANPHWTPAEKAQLGGFLTPAMMYDLAADMTNQLAPLIESMFTPNLSTSDFEWILSQNRKMTDAHAATLFLHQSSLDWRDVFPRITVPSLVLGGELSIGPASAVEWVATQIPGAQHYTFTAAEKGSHFVFWENPGRFNSMVEDFITQ
ncbi:Alpha/Beta hydrolase protein [Apodospora peruviana]|uniref:Alpha/Beta hydrolase protein n=1 Tax=Apodospora peruviana TaxID=516989 RepID=A0AAE0IBY9_9PEZI|nr:Alpha/Beta hydrolase protein [Apodospora peruviana]